MKQMNDEQLKYNKYEKSKYKRFTNGRSVDIVAAKASDFALPLNGKENGDGMRNLKQTKLTFERKTHALPIFGRLSC